MVIFQISIETLLYKSESMILLQLLCVINKYLVMPSLILLFDVRVMITAQFIEQHLNSLISLTYFIVIPIIIILILTSREGVILLLILLLLKIFVQILLVVLVSIGIQSGFVLFLILVVVAT